MNDQRSLPEQLDSLWRLATKYCLYDAADWLENRINELKDTPLLEEKEKI
jgi:hypothetical protein